MKNTTHNHLYLSGGGDEHQSAALDKLFFATIPHYGSLLYVPVALRGHRLYEGAESWIRGIADKHGREDVHITTLNNLAQVAPEQAVHHDALYIGGGNTWTLMEEIMDGSFHESIKLFYQQKRPIYGGSAGAIILGSRIDTHDDENVHKWSSTAGLGLMGTWSIACHFTENMLERYRVWAKDHNEPILCIPEEAGLVYDGSTFTNTGPGTSVVVHADGTYKILNATEELPVK